MDITIVFLIFVAICAAVIGYFVFEIAYNIRIPNLTGKHVLVTGGSSGIGKAVAIEVVKRGANVTIIARNKVNLNVVKEQIIESCADTASQKITVLPLDVTQSFDLTKNEIDLLEANVGPVFLLVNCAGSAECATFEDSTESNFRRMIELNLIGTILPTKAVIHHMIKRQQGIVVITSSQAALLGIYGMGAYCASKWGLRGFAETLHQEMAPHNISVTMCLPPDTDTPGFANENKDKPEETKIICQGGGLVSPDAVAQKLLSDAFKRRFWSTVGSEGVLLTLGCAGFGPLSSIPEVCMQVLLASLVRFISIFHLRGVAHTIAEFKLKRSVPPTAKKQE